MTQRPARHRDDGAILPLVMVATFILGMIVVTLTGYVTADLRYSNIVESRADRLAAADGAMRFGVENLRNFKTLCTTKAGTGGGFTTVFPPTINGSTSDVTCRRVGGTISDLQGWGVVVTGEGVPNGQPYFTTKGAGGSTGNIKTFNGPVYINDPERMDLQSRMLIQDGDLWYTRSNCDASVTIPSYLDFSPDFFRGPSCTDLTWNGGLFTPPTRLLPTAQALGTPAAVDTSDANCRVFSPGKYTSITLGNNGNYFKAGDYYFENVYFDVRQKTVIAGFPTGNAGDSAKVDTTACRTQMINDQASGAVGGATFWFGGSSAINVDNQGQFEIFRRRQNETFLSVAAVPSNGSGYVASNLGWNDWLLETKSGSNNDVAIHGLVWAPRAGMTLGNITNAANGQLLGGVVLANMDTQASASASAFAIGIEANPVDVRLLLIATARKGSEATVIRSVVQFRPDTKELAVNSWRVVSG
jgi:hypothetical protein